MVSVWAVLAWLGALVTMTTHDASFEILLSIYLIYLHTMLHGIWSYRYIVLNKTTLLRQPNCKIIHQ